MTLTVTPRRIRLETSSVCQLRCPSCVNPQGRIPRRGYLRLEDFKTLVDGAPTLREVEISNWGEVFLNPDLLGIMACAFDRRIDLYCENGANLNTVSEEVLEGVVKYRLRSLFCSIDGASQATYGQYRIGGDFAAVIGNIERINAFKKRYRCRFPVLTWQFIVFPHNAHEVPRARAMASKLGMGFYTKRSWEQDRPGEPGVAEEQPPGKARALLGKPPVLRRGPNLYMCAQLWTGPQIDYDGEMLGCCKIFQPWGAGNVFASGLLAVVNGEKMRLAREMVLGRGDARDDIPCAHCRRFEWMRRHDAWLSIPKLTAMRLMLRARRLVPVGGGLYTRLHGAALRFMD